MRAFNARGYDRCPMARAWRHRGGDRLRLELLRPRRPGPRSAENVLLGRERNKQDGPKYLSHVVGFWLGGDLCMNVVGLAGLEP